MPNLSVCGLIIALILGPRLIMSTVYAAGFERRMPLSHAGVRKVDYRQRFPLTVLPEAVADEDLRAQAAAVENLFRYRYRFLESIPGTAPLLELAYNDPPAAADRGMGPGWGLYLALPGDAVPPLIELLAPAWQLLDAAGEGLWLIGDREVLDVERMVSGTATPSPTPSATARSVSSSSNKPKRGGGLG